MKGYKDVKQKGNFFEEKQERREFLKNLGKATLPAIAFLGMGSFVSRLNASQGFKGSSSKLSNDNSSSFSGSSCENSCEGGCFDNCVNTCKGDCKFGCTSCDKTCTGGCDRQVLTKTDNHIDRYGKSI